MVLASFGLCLNIVDRFIKFPEERVSVQVCVNIGFNQESQFITSHGQSLPATLRGNWMVNMNSYRNSLKPGRLLGYACIWINLIGGSLAQAADTYGFDRVHTEIRFYYDHGGVSEQSGEFTSIIGTLNLDEDEMANSEVSMTIGASSVTSGVRSLDRELKSARYFSEEKHPDITFVSTRFDKINDDEFLITGDLTIRGITKPIEVKTKINHRGKHKVATVIASYRGDWLGITAETTFLRSEFGMTAYIPVVSDRVRVEISAELRKK